MIDHDLPALPVDWLEFTHLVGLALNNASLLSVLPIAGDRWEEVLASVFGRMGFNVQWTPGSHAPGADIRLDKDGYKPVHISVKAGSLKKGTILSFSSYRTTKLKTIEEKIAYIDKDANHVDWYLFAARSDTKTARKYQIFLAKATIIDAGNAHWTGVNGGWLGVQDNQLTLKIVKNMSDQLWVDVPVSLINHNVEAMSRSAAKNTEQGALVSTIDINKPQLGSRIDLLFSPIFEQVPAEGQKA